jgi:redox-sensing transcriptional repressor
MARQGEPRKPTRAVPGGGKGASEPRLSRASVGRLSLYLRRLEEVLRDGATRVSSGALGEALGIPDTQVRKDLASLGRLGQPGIGYDVADLVGAIRSTLGIDRGWSAALVGVGNLARALLRYDGFVERGFRIVALFDADPGKVGQVVEGLTIHPPGRMPEVIAATRPELGILTVPAQNVQNVADDLIAAGVKGLLNFAPGVVRVPPGVSVVNVDLTVQLEQLAFLVHLARMMGGLG